MITNYEYRQKSGTLILLNCPETFTLCLDIYSFSIRAKFMGIKFVPPGTHFLSLLLPTKNSFKKGFFFTIGKQTHIIKKFDFESENFVDLEKEEEENIIIGSKNLEFESYLAKFPTDSDSDSNENEERNYNNWLKITNFIDESIINKYEPISHIFHNEMIFSSFFTEIDISKSELKQNYLDKTKYFSTILSKNYKQDIKEFFGEMQMTFIIYQMCELFEGFEQWIKLIKLFLSSFDYSKNLLLNNQENQLISFFEIFYDMLRFVSRDFFKEENTLLNIIEQYLEEMKEYSKEKYHKVYKVFSLFEDFLGEYFGVIVKTEEDKIIEYCLLKMKINETNESNDSDKTKLKKLKYYLDSQGIDEEDLPIIVGIND